MCLTGPSGVGKTTLALEVAGQLVAGGGAAGGCVWVDLAGARTWHDVEARLMIALGLIKVGQARKGGEGRGREGEGGSASQCDGGQGPGMGVIMGCRGPEAVGYGQRTPLPMP